MNWQTWLNGLIGAIINSVATGVVLIFTGLATNPMTGTIEWTRLGLACTILAILGAALYLKQHPTPTWDGTERRDVTAPPAGQTMQAPTGGTS
jgi:hypothetical protein